VIYEDANAEAPIRQGDIFAGLVIRSSALLDHGQKFMSKQSEAKEKQGYVPKAKPKTCVNCKHFAHEQILMKTPWSSYTKDTNLRCTLGGFKVMKMGTCNEWANDQAQRPALGENSK